MLKIQITENSAPISIMSIYIFFFLKKKILFLQHTRTMGISQITSFMRYKLYLNYYNKGYQKLSFEYFAFELDESFLVKTYSENHS